MARDYKKLYEKKFQECKKITEKYNNLKKYDSEKYDKLIYQRRVIQVFEKFLPKKQYKIVFRYKNNSDTFITDACHYDIAILQLKNKISMQDEISIFHVEVDIISIEVLAF